MNVTFMIGNGFDLNLGLKTSYADFLEWYKDPEQCENDTEEISMFKSRLHEEWEKWSDLELYLGEYSIYCNDIEDYISCFNDILIKLNDYIDMEEKRIIEILKTKEVNFDERATRGISFFWEEIKTLGENTITKKYNETNFCDPKIECNVINFNYTSYISKKIFSMHSRNFDKFYLSSNNNIHGTINNGIVIGVNDKQQLKKFISEDDIQYVIKPTIVQFHYNKNLNEVLGILNNTKILYIYGMSLGETDGFWWGKIYELLKNKQMDSIIINIIIENSELMDIKKSTIKYSKYLNKLKQDILKKISINSEDEVNNDILEKINIVFNSKIFDCIKDIAKT